MRDDIYVETGAQGPEGARGGPLGRPYAGRRGGRRGCGAAWRPPGVWGGAEAAPYVRLRADNVRPYALVRAAFLGLAGAFSALAAFLAGFFSTLADFFSALAASLAFSALGLRTGFFRTQR